MIRISLYRVPEVPVDTPETNPLMKQDDYPIYKAIDVKKHAITGIGKMVLDLKAGVSQVERTLEDPNLPKTFQNVIEPIEKLTAPVSYCWNTFKNLSYVKNNEDIKKAMEMLQPVLLKARAARFQSLPVYKSVKELDRDIANLTESQHRVVQKYLLEASLNGVELTGYDQEHLNNVLLKLANEKNKFRYNVLTCTNSFKHVIYDEGDIEDMPESIKQLIAIDSTRPNRGPWVVTLQLPVYTPFMQYCSNREMRENAWLAYNSRASFSEKTTNNSAVIEEIRTLRQDQASILGFNNYAEMSMQTKMAGNVKTVHSMIATLKQKASPAMEEEILQLHEFAKERGFAGPLEWWDIPYWRRKQKNSLFNIDDEELRRYFSLPKVLEGLFTLTSQLFAVTIKKCAGEIDVWDEDVEVFKVFDEGEKQIAAFYLDLYARPFEKMPGAWVESGRNRSDICNAMPLAYVNCNLPPPVLNQPVLMSFDDVRTLFHEFGHALQHLLTVMPYTDVAGLANVEWDAVEICSTFMENWLYDRHTMNLISGHVDTGAALPDDMLNSLRQVRTHLSAFDMCKQLYLSAFDLEMYTTKTFWLDVLRQLLPQYMPMMSVHKRDAHPCSFTHIFSEEYPAAFYSYKWSEMMSADLFSAFEEVGLDNRDALGTVGRRFRDTFLALGGGCHPSEVFRRFRGRDPSPDALLQKYNLSDVSS